jgi:predicted DNA-binding protein
MTEDRFSSISGLLTARPQRKTATVHHINPEPVDAEPNVADAADTAPTPKSRESAGGNRRVVFKIPPELHTRLVDHAKRTGASHGNIVLDAVETAYMNDTLADLVAAARRPTLETKTALFARTAPRENAAPSVTVEIQLRAQAVDQLDQLVTQYAADNRTQLLTAALQQHLD